MCPFDPFVVLFLTMRRHRWTSHSLVYQMMPGWRSQIIERTTLHLFLKLRRQPGFVPWSALRDKTNLDRDVLRHCVHLGLSTSKLLFARARRRPWGRATSNCTSVEPSPSILCLCPHLHASDSWHVIHIIRQFEPGPHPRLIGSEGFHTPDTFQTALFFLTPCGIPEVLFQVFPRAFRGVTPHLPLSICMCPGSTSSFHWPTPATYRTNLNVAPTDIPVQSFVQVVPKVKNKRTLRRQLCRSKSGISLVTKESRLQSHSVLP